MDINELVCIRNGEYGGPVVLLIPFAGGSAQSYFSWKSHFPAHVSLYALELPGRGRCFSRAWPRHIQELVPGLAKRCRDEQIQPDIVFGHSFGALIAFELLREMRRNHSKLPHTAVLSGRIAASHPVTFGIPDLSPTQLVAYLRDLGGTPEAILQNQAMLKMTLPILRKDLELLKRYEFNKESPLATNVMLLGGLDDQRVPIEGLTGWREEFAGTFDLRMYPGGHFFIEQHRQAITNLICELVLA